MYVFNVIKELIRRVLFDFKNLKKGYMIAFNCTLKAQALPLYMQAGLKLCEWIYCLSLSGVVI